MDANGLIPFFMNVLLHTQRKYTYYQKKIKQCLQCIYMLNHNKNSLTLFFHVLPQEMYSTTSHVKNNYQRVLIIFLLTQLFTSVILAVISLVQKIITSVILAVISLVQKIHTAVIVLFLRSLPRTGGAAVSWG